LNKGQHSVDCAWTDNGLVGSIPVFGGSHFAFRFRFAISPPRDRNDAKRQPCDQNNFEKIQIRVCARFKLFPGKALPPRGRIVFAGDRNETRALS
jgi:hypothetical protein